MIFSCNQCNARVQMADEVEYTKFDEEAIEHIYTLGRCSQCSSPGIVKTRTARDFDLNKPSEQLHPPVGLVQSSNIPPLVAESYREAKLCQKSRANIATAVMARRTLEATAQSFDPSARNLFEGLRAMKDQGVISEELFAWGDHLRFLGNIGAHPKEGEAVSTDDTRDLMQFLDAIIETIYVLRPRFEAMVARRKKQADTGDTGEAEA